MRVDPANAPALDHEQRDAHDDAAQDAAAHHEGDFGLGTADGEFGHRYHSS